MAQGGLEPSTCCLGGSRSIQLSYWVKHKAARATCHCQYYCGRSGCGTTASRPNLECI